MRDCVLRPFALAALGLAMVGCSTWRSRGFVGRQDRASVEPTGSYVIDSIEFRRLKPGDEQCLDRHPSLMWMSERDAFVGTSYVEDISEAAGLTNKAAAKPVRIKISIVPIDDRKSGASTVWWPLAATLGVFPAHLMQEVTFDVIVQFESEVSAPTGKSTHYYADACVALVRTDSQFGLSRMDMDAPPPAVSAAAEFRDDGTIGTGRNLRLQRFRRTFVEAVAAVVRDEIAIRERLVREPRPQPASEFGPVDFPQADRFERENTPGWGNSPDGTEFVLEKTVEDYLKRAWNYPRDAFEVNMKRSVEKGLLTKSAWEKALMRHYEDLKAESGS